MITEAAAAAMLSIGCDTLRDWETRFGYPSPLHPGKDPLYAKRDVLALQEALCSALSINSAIARARGAASDEQEKRAQGPE